MDMILHQERKSLFQPKKSAVNLKTFKPQNAFLAFSLVGFRGNNTVAVHFNPRLLASKIQPKHIKTSAAKPDAFLWVEPDLGPKLFCMKKGNLHFNLKNL